MNMTGEIEIQTVPIANKSYIILSPNKNGISYNASVTQNRKD